MKTLELNMAILLDTKKGIIGKGAQNWPKVPNGWGSYQFP